MPCHSRLVFVPSLAFLCSCEACSESRKPFPPIVSPSYCIPIDLTWNSHCFPFNNPCILLSQWQPGPPGLPSQNNAMIWHWTFQLHCLVTLVPIVMITLGVAVSASFKTVLQSYAAKVKLSLTCCCIKCRGKAVRWWKVGEGGNSSWLLCLRRHSKLKEERRLAEIWKGGRGCYCFLELS